MLRNSFVVSRIVNKNIKLLLNIKVLLLFLAMDKSTVIITGASGLLGRALLSKFSDGKWKKVIGTAFSRSVTDRIYFYEF